MKFVILPLTLAVTVFISRVHAQTCETLFRTQDVAGAIISIGGDFPRPGVRLTAGDRLKNFQTRFNIPEGSFRYKVLEAFLSHRHIQQDHMELIYRQLLVVGGGLCGPTCFANISKSISGNLREDSANLISDPPRFIGEIVRRANFLNGPQHDARMGTNAEQIIKTAESLKEDGTIPDVVSVRRGPTGGSTAALAPGPNSVAMIAITTASAAHWIILIDVNRTTQEALILDPNDSNQPHVVFIGEKLHAFWVWHEPYARGANFHDIRSWSQLTQSILFQYTDLLSLTPEMHDAYRK